jgi:hypothetical protein
MIKNTIQCCKDCVAPKRHIGCHGHCPEYLGEKAMQDERRNAAIKKKKTSEAVHEVMWYGKKVVERRK